MDTKILDVNEQDIKTAGEILKNGGIVAIPTETVYGLAANALDPKAVKNIYIAKGRPSDNPLIVHISEFDEIYPLVKNIPEVAKTLAEKYWGGPLTMIFEKSDLIPNETSGGLDTVAIRMPQSETAKKIIKSAGVPLAAPSANLSGKPSPTTFNHVFEDMNGRVEAIVKGEDCEVGVESTVITLATNPPLLLRPGAVSFEELSQIIPNIEIAKAVTTHVNDNQKVASPGMKYQHYSPKAKIVMSKLSFVDYVEYINNNDCNALCFDGEEKYLNKKAVTYGKIYDSENQAQKIFSALHELDEKGFEKVIARAPLQTGVGLAVYNRLIRACGFDELLPKTKIIGLTGTTGAGKSTVAKTLTELGCKIIDCDKISRDPETYKGECLEKLCLAFGKDIVENGILNRRKLAQKAFLNPQNTEKLNEITLPVISQKIDKIINQYKEEKVESIVLDAPTLFEASADKFCTHIIAVVASDDLRLERIIKRDNIDISQAKARMNSQHDNEFYIKRANFVVNTDKNFVDKNELKLFLERD